MKFIMFKTKAKIVTFPKLAIGVFHQIKAIKFMHVTFVFLLTTIWFSISCKNNNSVEPDDRMTITWQQTPLDSVNSSFHSLAINSSNHVFVGTVGHGVFRSEDHGETWTDILDGFGPRSIVISPKDHIFAAKNSALMQLCKFFSVNLKSYWSSSLHQVFLDSSTVAIELMPGFRQAD